MIREHFIAAAVPTQMRDAKNPEGEFLRAAGLDKHWVTSSGYMSCVSASGKWLGHAPSEKVLAQFQKLPEAERKPGAVVVADLKPSERVIPEPPAGGMVLKVYARFLSRDEKGGLRHARREDFRKIHTFMLSPNTEYMWLTREELLALIPDNPKVGDRHPVPPALVERLARFHLSPPRALTSEDRIIRKQAIKQAELALIVADVSSDRLRLTLEGRIHWGSDFDAAQATSPNGPLELGFATPLYGKLEFDRRRQQCLRCEIVAPGEVWGRWGDANNNSMGIERPGRSPIGFALELATGDSPTNRLPPAGNGYRALRAGYFSAAQ
ncbi:MAG: hypothetical protein LC104_17540 [Bacteroidales bacterium]|nr:hypothetical protein [Bacteroidales bacterium]